MVALLTLVLLLGPPAAAIGGAYVYYGLRRRKGKRSRLKFFIVNVPLSFLSAHWLTYVIDNAPRLGVEPSDVQFLQQVKAALTNIPLLEALPGEVRLVLVLTLIIFLIMLPGP